MSEDAIKKLAADIFDYIQRGMDREDEQGPRIYLTEIEGIIRNIGVASAVVSPPGAAAEATCSPTARPGSGA